MSDIQMIYVNVLEYVALRNLDKAVRVCMANPNAGEFLVEAVQALNAVRHDLGIEENAPLPQVERKASPLVTDLATALIERAMEKK
jgi:hypothetical protein